MVALSKKTGHESGNYQYRALQKNQSADGKELSQSTSQESKRYCVGRTETVRYCTVYCRYGTREPLIGNTLEGIGQLCYEGTNTQLQDCQIYCEVQADSQDVEYESSVPPS